MFPPGQTESTGAGRVQASPGGQVQQAGNVQASKRLEAGLAPRSDRRWCFHKALREVSLLVK
ncbi:hypothetical protein IAQ61_010804 [Plenodomus lingam]|uniref:uncharacterized protein n=1 Tax=Leptosphaeria maculans TaxID=5022 RepID=UPI00331DC11B|nr:hypothetical protein IAQ61_010804 [Plenodomus lingam]